MRHAIALHREALQHPDLEQFLDDLDTLHDQLKAHWAKVYGDLISRALLLQDMILFQQSLIAKLLEYYTNKPYTIDRWTLDQARCVIGQDGRAGARDGSNTDKTYQVHVVYPLDEMMLSRDLVGNKLRAAAKEANSGSDIQPLIDRCDWSNLARALKDDRELALQLFEGQPLEMNKRERILRGISRIKSKDFAELSDPSTFTISTHAGEMSAGQALNQTHNRYPSTPLTIAPSDTGHYSENHSRRKAGFPWSIYNTISGLERTKSSLKSGAYPPSYPDDRDNMTPHIDVKKTE